MDPVEIGGNRTHGDPYTKSYGLTHNIHSPSSIPCFRKDPAKRPGIASGNGFLFPLWLSPP